LTQQDFVVASMHDKKDLQRREIVMEQFSSGAVRVLVTTDKFARGINVEQAGLVINFELP